ncbi:MAG: putative quinol monooxygenase [Anaerolineales bacterium]
MPLAQIVHLDVQPDKLAEFLSEAAANARASRLEPGVLQFDLLQHAEMPTKFMLYEIYTDAAALEAHRATPHFARWLERGVPLLTGERVRVLYHPLDVETIA